MRTKALVQRIDLKRTHEALVRCHHSSASGGAGRYEVYTNKCHMWRQSCVCNNLPFLCRGKHLSVIDHGAHQPQSIIYWYRSNSGKALRHRSTIDCSWCSFRMWHSWLPPWYHQYEVVKALPAGIALNYLGDPKASLDDVMTESTHFISACYEQKTYPPDTMHRFRYKVWVSRTGRNGPSILPKLK